MFVFLEDTGYHKDLFRTERAKSKSKVDSLFQTFQTIASNMWTELCQCFYVCVRARV